MKEFLPFRWSAKAVTSLLIWCVILPCSLDVFAQTYTPEDVWKDAQIASRDQKSATAQKRLEWFRDARFGMFNADSIVAQAKSAGMGYIVMVTDWNLFPSVLPSIPMKIKKAQLLNGPAIEFSQEKTGIRLNVDVALRAADATVIKLIVDGKAGEIVPLSIE